MIVKMQLDASLKTINRKRLINNSQNYFWEICNKDKCWCGVVSGSRSVCNEMVGSSGPIILRIRCALDIMPWTLNILFLEAIATKCFMPTSVYGYW